MRLLSAAVLVGGLALTACAPAIELQTASAPDASQAVVVAAFLGQTEVDFRSELVLESQQGRLVDVAITDPSGALVGGKMANGMTEWHVPAGSLKMATKYGVATTAVDRYGNTVVGQSDFTTMTPTNVNDYSFSLRDGSTYGVGMPISIRFNKPVVDKAAVEGRLKLTTSVPVEGSWSWVGDSTVSYRPREYWPAGVAVSVAAPLRGIETEPDLFVLEDRSMNFQIGRSFIAIVDAATHQMTVRSDGNVVRTVPITTGKPGWETRSGIKVIMSKERHVIMDAATLGVDKEDPEYYRLDVDYALRVTNSGEFVHAAPWSVASQGIANVSHGCVGMSTSNASWFYDNARIGDVVQVTNTGRTQDRGNGITVWNESWESWTAGSALGGA